MHGEDCQYWYSIADYVLKGVPQGISCLLVIDEAAQVVVCAKPRVIADSIEVSDADQPQHDEDLQQQKDFRLQVKE